MNQENYMSEHEAQAVRSLLLSEINFKRLYDKHHYLDQQVKKATEGDLAVDDMSLEKMKKEKLLLKDQIQKMVMEFSKNQAIA